MCKGPKSLGLPDFASLIFAEKTGMDPWGFYKMLTACSRTQALEQEGGTSQASAAGEAAPPGPAGAPHRTPASLTKHCLHTSNCLVMGIGVIVHRPVPGRAQGSSSTFAEPISPMTTPCGLPFAVPAE